MTMSPRNLKIFIATGLSCLLSISPLVAAQAESNVWDQRRVRLARSDADRLLARLAVPIARPSPRSTVSSPFRSNIPSTDLLVSVAAVVSGHGTIRRRSDYRSNAAPVIVVEDLHGHAEAQRNIARIIGALIERHPDARIAVEGAAGTLDPSPFRSGDAALDREVAEALFNLDLIAGPDFAALLAPESARFVGAEDPALYRKNVAAVRTAMKSQPRARTVLNAGRAAVAALKERAYSPALKNLDALVTARETGAVGLGDFLSRLASHAAAPTVPRTSALGAFLAAHRLEREINFDVVETERDRLLRRFVERADPSALRGMLDASLALRGGDLTPAAFYADARRMMRQAGLPVERYAAFDAYISYLALVDGVDPEALFDAADRLEAALFDAVAETSEQRAVVALARDVRLAAGLIDLKLTPRHWARLRDRTAAFVRFSERVAAVGGRVDLAGWSALFSGFAPFYETAMARDAALFENLRDGADPRRVSLLVAGGFHSAGIERRLRSARVPFLIVSPRLGDSDGLVGNEYLRVFTRDKVALAEIFESPAVTLSPTSAFAPADPTNHRPRTLRRIIAPLRNALRNMVSHGIGRAVTGRGAVVAVRNGIAPPGVARGDVVAEAASATGTVYVVRRAVSVAGSVGDRIERASTAARRLILSHPKTAAAITVAAAIVGIASGRYAWSLLTLYSIGAVLTTFFADSQDDYRARLEQAVTDAGLLTAATADERRELRDAYNARIGGLSAYLSQGYNPIDVAAEVTEPTLDQKRRFIDQLVDGRFVEVVLETEPADGTLWPEPLRRLGQHGQTGRILAILDRMGVADGADIDLTDAKLVEAIAAAESGVVGTPEDLSFIQRRLLQNRLELERYVKDLNGGRGRGGLAFDAETVAERARFIVSVNASNRDIVARQLRAVNFAGFNPQRILLVETPESGGLRIRNGATIWDESAGHGLGLGANLASVAVGGERAYAFDEDGHLRPAGYEEPLSAVLEQNGVRYALISHSNDLQAFASENAARFAVAANLLDGSDTDAVIEVSRRSERRYGGAVLGDASGRVIVRDPLAMTDEQRRLLSDAPFVFRGLTMASIEALGRLPGADSPLYLIAHPNDDGGLYTLKSYPGDVTTMVPTRAMHGENSYLRVLESRADIPVALTTLRRQDEQAGFVALVGRILGEAREAIDRDIRIEEIPVQRYERARLVELYGEERISAIESRFQALGARGEAEIWNFNTGIGGGVADLLQAFLGHAAGLRGVEMRWLKFGLNGRFAATTKKFHNIFHGRELEADGKTPIVVAPEEWDYYMRVTRINARSLVRWVRENGVQAPDVVVVHDPQPAALFTVLRDDPEFQDFYRQFFADTKILWFAHIPIKNTSIANTQSHAVWSRLGEFVKASNAAIVHQSADYPADLDRPFVNTNSVDPLGYINIPLVNEAGEPNAFVAATEDALELPRDGHPWILQNARMDALKDPEGVVEAFAGAFRELAAEVEAGRLDVSRLPRLLFTGPLASDDGEAVEVLERVRRKAAETERALRAEIDTPLPDSKLIYDRMLYPQKPDGGAVDPHALPRLTAKQAEALAEMGIDPKSLTDYDIHNLMVNALQTRAEIIVMKSLEEGFGLAGAGAKLHGKPVIFGNRGGLGPQVEDGVTGFKVGLYDEDPWAELEPERLPADVLKKFFSDETEPGLKINNRTLSVLQTHIHLVDLIKNPEKGRRMGRAAKDNAMDLYTTLRQMEDMAGWFEATMPELGAFARAHNGLAMAVSLAVSAASGAALAAALGAEPTIGHIPGLLSLGLAALGGIHAAVVYFRHGAAVRAIRKLDRNAPTALPVISFRAERLIKHYLARFGVQDVDVRVRPENPESGWEPEAGYDPNSNTLYVAPWLARLFASNSWLTYRHFYGAPALSDTSFAKLRRQTIQLILSHEADRIRLSRAGLPPIIQTLLIYAKKPFRSPFRKTRVAVLSTGAAHPRIVEEEASRLAVAGADPATSAEIFEIIRSVQGRPERDLVKGFDAKEAAPAPRDRMRDAERAVEARLAAQLAAVVLAADMGIDPTAEIRNLGRLAALAGRTLEETERLVTVAAKYAGVSVSGRWREMWASQLSEWNGDGDALSVIRVTELMGDGGPYDAIVVDHLSRRIAAARDDRELTDVLVVENAAGLTEEAVRDRLRSLVLGGGYIDRVKIELFDGPVIEAAELKRRINPKGLEMAVFSADATVFDDVSRLVLFLLRDLGRLYDVRRLLNGDALEAARVVATMA